MNLKYDGAQVICVIRQCKNGCFKHVNSAQHKYQKHSQRPSHEFVFDLICMLPNIPFSLLDKRLFRTSGQNT